MSDSADMIGGKPYGVEELRSIVFGGAGDERVSREVALGLLGRKDYPEKVADFERVLADDREAPGLRTAAAVELGRVGSDAALDALVRHADVKHDLVARGVLNGLRHINSPRALEVAARRLETPQGGARSALARSKKWTAALLAFRHGVKGFDLSLPKRFRRVKVDPERAQQIRVSPPTSETLAKSLQDLATNPLGIELARERAVEMHCGDRELVFLFNRELSKQPGTRLFEEKAVVGLVAVRYTVEVDTYSTKYGVLVQPSQDDVLQILVTTTKGAVVLSGTGRPSGERVNFNLKAVDRPGVVAMEIEGAYTAEGLRFERAVSELHRRRPQLVPPLRKRRT
ncbi:MAG TPA: HEAT repeat domain-containing protein [Pyrinomonadaceae bacterium]|nr:HEAT repeat domain-containing protein [Pyrinomonadaceae bacterium]